MAIQINARPEAGFDDPLELLSDCHRRIERFLGQLLTLAERAGERALTGAERAATENALRYFAEALPRHTRDEEDSLFPWLRRAAEGDDPDRAEPARDALEEAARLEEDHRRAEADHAAVDALFRRWLAEGGLDAVGRERLHALLAGLSASYRDHIATEDGRVFPLAALALVEGDRRGMGREMARRRGLDADRLRTITEGLRK